MRRMLVIDNCIGCRLVETPDYVCLIPNEKVEECPCLSCLVKGICATACPDYKIAVEEKNKCHAMTAT